MILIILLISLMKILCLSKTIVQEKRREKIMKNFRKNQGITLIALVITVIVLLILAGITIATLTGDNGILTRA